MIPATSLLQTLPAWIMLLTSPLPALALTPNPLPAQTEVDQIRSLLLRQQDDWNRGDIRAFMTGYDKSDTLVFTSRGTVHRGWDRALQRYLKQYPDRQAMGRLRFSDLEITLLGESAALVLGRWELERKDDRPGGVFTLVLRKTPDGWRIVHDHTSSLP